MSMAFIDRNDGIVKTLMKYSSLGLEMGFCVVIGLAMGYYLDKWFKTSPYLTILFMMFGIGAASKAVYRAYKSLKEEDERNNRQ